MKSLSTNLYYERVGVNPVQTSRDRIIGPRNFKYLDYAFDYANHLEGRMQDDLYLISADYFGTDVVKFKIKQQIKFNFKAFGSVNVIVKTIISTYDENCNGLSQMETLNTEYFKIHKFFKNKTMYDIQMSCFALSERIMNYILF